MRRGSTSGDNSGRGARRRHQQGSGQARARSEGDRQGWISVT